MTEYQFTSLSFTQGFLLGQFSLAFLLFIFIKFFIFGDPPPTHARPNRARSLSTPYRPYNPIALSTSFSPPHRRHASSSASVLRPIQPLTTASVLAKTYYNVSNHQPESVDWFNVLVAQTIAQLRVDAAQDDAVVSALTGALNGPRKPDWLDDITVTEISLGEEFPIFSNCRVIPVDADATDREGRPKSRAGGDGTRLQARMDVDLADAVTLGIETKLVLNYPRPRVAEMPVALAVSVVRFSGTLSISFVSSPAPDGAAAAAGMESPRNGEDGKKRTTPPTTLTFSFEPSYRLELSTHSLLGSRARLQDVPKIGQLVEARLHAWFDERCVAPRYQQVVLPNLWPRAKNTGGIEVGLEKPRSRDEVDLTELDGTAREQAVPSDDNEPTPMRDRMTLPRMRKKQGEEAHKTVGVQHPSSGFQIPGSLPDG